MSQIFYSQVDPNLQQELTRRARAGKTDRSETALRYMTEKIANAQIIAYDGNRRDDNNIVHRLGGKTVLSGEYLPDGDYGFLTTRPYTLQTTSWVADVQNNSVKVESENIKEKLDNTSYRIPPFITGVELAINDNSRGLTNKATISITIPNPERDLDFMESTYARPGRYCALTIAHPDSALMTREIPGIFGFLDSGSLPSLELLKTNYPDAAKRYDELRKMNQIEFEGLITSFEYQYTTDGSVTMTVYILGTSMVYTDLSMIMQTGTTDETQASGSLVIEQAKSFYQAMRDEITKTYQIRSQLSLLINSPLAFYTSNDNDTTINRPATILHSVSSITGYVNIYANLNHVINFLNSKIISKLNGVLARPTIYCDIYHGVGSNVLTNICSSDPENVVLVGHLTTPNSELSPDCYGTLTLNSQTITIGKQWFTNMDLLKGQNAGDIISTFYPAQTESGQIQTVDGEKLAPTGRPGHIMINLKVVETIINELSGTKDQFTVKAFLERISAKINSATGGAINLQLVTHPTVPSILYFRDVNWIFSPIKPKPQPFLIPMFANDSRGTIVRDFKLSAKLPSNAQSLMYAINSSDKVTEDQVAPYMNFMYNNAAVKRTGTGANTTDTVVYGDKEITKKLAEQYLETHKKYKEQLITARKEFGADPTNTQKQIALAAALKKHVQYPRPTIEQSNQLAAPVFPIDAEFTIDGINGFRYGDIVDFPGIPEKYRRCTTFTIKGITHTVSDTGEWTTKITCMMRPKFD
jgi:hypothetical protein